MLLPVTNLCMWLDLETSVDIKSASLPMLGLLAEEALSGTVDNLFFTKKERL